ncbi:MAG: hypothetical protein IT353_23530 [Gemmatimonadaceae bacterium]|nr:hypothetical protein [Gemmatimonadaceae bacterium]
MLSLRGQIQQTVLGVARPSLKPFGVQMRQVRASLSVVGAVLCLHAHVAIAQPTTEPSRPVVVSPGMIVRTPPSFAERYAGELGVAYDSAAASRSAARESMARMVAAARAMQVLRASRTRDVTTSEPLHCPMPVATVDPRRMAPMPSAVADTAVGSALPVAGRLLGCVNPLSP